MVASGERPAVEPSSVSNPWARWQLLGAALSASTVTTFHTLKVATSRHSVGQGWRAGILPRCCQIGHGKKAGKCIPDGERGLHLRRWHVHFCQTFAESSRCIGRDYDGYSADHGGRSTQPDNDGTAVAVQINSAMAVQVRKQLWTPPVHSMPRLGMLMW